MAVLGELERRGVAARSLCADSRRLARGDVFVAYPGQHVDGRRFIADALAKGAAAVLYEATGTAQDQKFDAVPAVPVRGLAQLVGEIAHLVYGRPSERLRVIGVTGTNGKTSVSQWVAQALNALGQKCAVIGTLGNGFPGELLESGNTTPEAVALHRDLADYLARGAAACAMEVSSIGLDQGRANGVHFAAAVFTNLTRDHLEYHGSMEAYAAAKARLFEVLDVGTAVLNLDDAFGVELAQRLRGRLRTIGYTLQDAAGADEVLAARDLSADGVGMTFTLGDVRVTAPVVGRFNASNLLAVLGALAVVGIPLADAARALSGLQSPPGRMQALGGVAAPLVVVDYAHTPDALEKVLATLRETAGARGGRLVCVFGCGGERDPGKRPLMGAVAERMADAVLVTSDNPRGEDPDLIIAAILAGMASRPIVEPERARAIQTAVLSADARDVIVLAGKGHEPYQEIAGLRHSFSDLAHARNALERRK